ncbi:hypothetical protein [Clostridium saccharoperbutylacetonicum]|uniref:hypothetical protein n=1 Tax=Clostridium saccharoperbutylacetonicum TaxID=36745 RepID=UPI0039E7A312
MEISDLIKNALKDVGLPVYFLKRNDETSECIIYNYIETPNGYGDMKESSTKYTVLLNLYCKTKIEANKKKVKNAMLNAGFKKITIAGTVLEQNSLYNTALQFKIALVNQG